MVKQLKKVHSLSCKIATAFSSSDLESRKIENKSALVNRKDPFSIKNLVQHGLYRSIRDRKFNGSVKIPKLISLRTTLLRVLDFSDASV